jgi:hypothetical protein
MTRREMIVLIDDHQTILFSQSLNVGIDRADFVDHFRLTMRHSIDGNQLIETV